MARSSPLSKKCATASLNEGSDGNTSLLCLTYGIVCTFEEFVYPRILARLSASLVSMCRHVHAPAVNVLNVVQQQFLQMVFPLKIFAPTLLIPPARIGLCTSNRRGRRKHPIGR